MNLTADKIRAQIAFIRANANMFLIDTAQLLRRTGETYTNGQVKPTYATAEDINCRLITRSGSESNNIAAQPREVQQTTFTGLFRMQIPYDVEIHAGDQILYTDKESGTVRRFDVVFAPPRHTYTGAVVIQLEEIK